MNVHKIILRTKDSGSIKSLLKKGIIPGVIYGKGTESIKVCFEKKTLSKLMQNGGFFSKIIDLDINGKKEKVLPKELQYHPVSDNLIHFDFLRVHNETKVTVEVPVEFLNQDTCPGLKKGGVLNIVRRVIELSCNANNIPEKLIYDLISSEIGDAVKISNIELPENVKPTITDRDFVIATLVPPTVEAEPEPKAEEEGKEGEESESKDEVKADDKGESKTEPKDQEKKEASESKEKSK